MKIKQFQASTLISDRATIWWLKFVAPIFPIVLTWKEIADSYVWGGEKILTYLRLLTFRCMQIIVNSSFFLRTFTTCNDHHIVFKLIRLWLYSLGNGYSITRFRRVWNKNKKNPWIFRSSLHTRGRDLVDVRSAFICTKPNVGSKGQKEVGDKNFGISQRLRCPGVTR